MLVRKLVAACGRHELPFGWYIQPIQHLEPQNTLGLDRKVEWNIAI